MRGNVMVRAWRGDVKLGGGGNGVKLGQCGVDRYLGM